MAVTMSLSACGPLQWQGTVRRGVRCREEAIKDPNDIWYRGWAAVELIEAASRTNGAAQARPALEQLVESTNASGTEWAFAVQARCAPSLLTRAKRKPCTKRLSSGYSRHGCTSTWPVPGCCTESGSVVSSASETLEPN